MLTYSTVTATIGSKDHYNQLKPWLKPLLQKY